MIGVTMRERLRAPGRVGLCPPAIYHFERSFSCFLSSLVGDMEFIPEVFFLLFF